ncbi:hypothetical protein DQX05_26985 [Paenibacillus thiaminolyticus]|uniref:Uncharacterized protein n=1 Tax=Paenibacillus thiaminolyticus TaxID=49283 RepID=A0A3A3G9Q1_PANTH|nr:hypothetical protein DQX05_26985 [Paenibacillus thiaminolyticus]
MLSGLQAVKPLEPVWRRQSPPHRWAGGFAVALAAGFDAGVVAAAGNPRARGEQALREQEKEV